MPSRRRNRYREMVIVYVDGSCRHNGSEQAYAGIGVFWGDDSEDNISKPLEGPATNQRAEIQAAVEALKMANCKGYRRLIIRSDSEHLVKGVNIHIHKWQENGWITCKGRQVANIDDWLELLDEMDELEDVRFEHVPGHQDNYGNEMADELAKIGAEEARYLVGY